MSLPCLRDARVPLARFAFPAAAPRASRPQSAHTRVYIIYILSRSPARGAVDGTPANGHRIMRGSEGQERSVVVCGGSRTRIVSRMRNGNVHRRSHRRAIAKGGFPPEPRILVRVLVTRRDIDEGGGGHGMDRAGHPGNELEAGHDSEGVKIIGDGFLGGSINSVGGADGEGSGGGVIDGGGGGGGSDRHDDGRGIQVGGAIRDRDEVTLIDFQIL
ncbi:hypothetical protein B0H17DRAFT_1131888 [Mycena rosella]|uniref:Uncharacterized protein n=1 Tax=Mycena rosella TaxID=1033263 RepID=A0AAD7DNR2_MYCRO|nr:hypothetical protein B0H17DRAFT_1131888 [Mycena rosella]